MEKKIHITVCDDIPLDKAVGFVQRVIKHGRDTNGKFTCLTLIHDTDTNQHVCVHTIDNRKSDCFKVYLNKHYDKFGNWVN